MTNSLSQEYVMDRVSVDLKHCYGIKGLKKDFEFAKVRAYAIYAPNGVMKSSLAQTFKDAAEGTESEDRIFPDRKTTRKIVDEAGVDIDGERILVVLPYDPEFGVNEKTSTLLVDPTLRKEYEQLHIGIDKAKAALLKAVREQGKSKKDFENEISSTFTRGDDLEVAVTRIKAELEKQKDTPFADVKYDIIFDEKVVKALEAKDLKDAIEGYIRRYNELLTASTYFRKGTFDYFNAGQIAKSLADNGFFDALHTINLKSSGAAIEINTQKELEGVISKEKEAIIKDAQLRKSFDVVAKALNRNAELREFARYLQENEPLLSRMNNLEKFKEDILKSYLKVHHDLYLALMATYEAAAKRIKAIHEEARKQRTQWEEVISIFNERFFVPFELEARNRIEVMLGDAEVIDLGFTYKDGADSMEIEKADLMKVLSTGERKALYVLNVIFEIQRRMKANQETLVVVDDIADSFDYSNKYAIIQYLKDISEDGLFKLIIMTHNFDFFRTIEGRFVGYPNCLMASKNDNGISLAKATGIRNVFANDWKDNFFTDPKKKIASICFLRNLIEMTTGDTDPNYLLLTSMMHWKADTPKITVDQLDTVFNSVCKTGGNSGGDASKFVYDLMTREADGCLGAQAGLGLECKILLAVASRMGAERFMIGKINDEKFVANIKANQTSSLIKKFREKFPKDNDALKCLDRVALMTPENIHVNSFMYEPIVDMSDEHLKRLYGDVKKLT
jgi:ABC-type lipoprotein export system ATPase subunit